MKQDAESNLVNNTTCNENNKLDNKLKNGTCNNNLENAPPDGGARAWMVMVGSFFCNGILFGVLNSYSLMYADLHKKLEAKNVTDASSKASLVGSLAFGTTFFLSPVSGVLTDQIGIRSTTFLGGIIASSGMFLSSFCIDNINLLYVTYGVMYGLGGAMAYTPSLAILGQYFKKYLGIVNGIVTLGSSVFTIIMSYLIDAFLKQYGIVWTLRLLALSASGLTVCAVLFKPRYRSKNYKKKVQLSEVFNLEVLSNKKYVIWASFIAISLFGYFVPYVYAFEFVKQNFPSEVDGKVPVLCISITSAIGRLIFGYISDFPRVNRIFLQQIAFFSIGVLTMLLPVSTGNFPLLVAISLGMGLFDGSFISLLGPIAFDICGKDGASQAIGFLLGMCSFPLIIGPFVAGKIYDRTKTYTLPFVLAGIPPILGAIAMTSVYYVRTKEPLKEPAAQPLQKVPPQGKILLSNSKVSRKVCDSNGNIPGQRTYSYSIL